MPSGTAPLRLALLAVLGLGGPGAARAEPADYAQRAAALVEPYLESGLFSGAILVAQDGRPIFRRADGLANREWGVANTLDTRFRIGSLTKSFTAAAILRLAEDGRLGLDDPIRRFYPDAPGAWAGVSLRHLLQHRSGIINFTALPDYYARISRLERTPREIVALTEGEPLLFPPGSRFEYSNTNYILLGMAIEAASGLPYARYLQETVLGPLGLRDTAYDDATAILPRRASGYRRGQAQWRNAGPMASSVGYAAGGLYGTVDDLLAWDLALTGDRLLSAASRAAMFDDRGTGYGLGWFVGHTPGQGGAAHRLWSHGGSVPGFLAINDRYPDDGLTVIVLANTETAPAQKIARELAALAFGQFDPPDPIVLEAVILERYVGTYRLESGGLVTVRRDGGRLLARVSGEAAFPFQPESDRTFFARVTDARITFDTEPDGTPTGLVMHRHGSDRIALRLEGEEARHAVAAAPPEHREVAIDRSRIGLLAGRYALAPDRVLTITAQDGRLYAEGAGQPRNELFPEGERSFFLRSAEAQIAFAIGPDGRATDLTLRRDGTDMRAPRVEPDGAPPAAPSR